MCCMCTVIIYIECLVYFSIQLQDTLDLKNIIWTIKSMCISDYLVLEEFIESILRLLIVGVGIFANIVEICN